MTVELLTAVTDTATEAALVTAFDRRSLGLTVVRRCVDLPDLLAAATVGTARAALVSADLRRFDQDACVRLAADGLAVVGLVPAGDEEAERRLRQLGIADVVAADAPAERVAAAVLAAVRRGRDPQTGAYSSPLSALPSPGAATPQEQAEDGEERPRGRVVAVWGPTGAPGRTTVATGLAGELAGFGQSTLLVDADTYGGAIAQLLGVLDESPGLAAATRAANQGTLDLPRLAGLARDLGGGLRVLAGIARPARWPELRPGSLDVVLGLARQLAAWTVVDCGFCLEEDEELSYDTAAPRRNGVTIAALRAADTVMAVAGADPIGLHRFIRAFGDLRELLDGSEPWTVANRVRQSVVPGNPNVEIAASLARHAGTRPRAFIPLDVPGLDAAHARGLQLRDAAPDSAARGALLALANELAGRPLPPPRRRGRLRRT